MLRCAVLASLITLGAGSAPGVRRHMWRAVASGPAVSGQAAALHAESGRLLCFGGLDPKKRATDELWAFDADGGGTWSKLEAAGRGLVGPTPGPRMYSAACVIDGSFFLCGGWDPGAPGSGGTFFDDVWELDLETLTWRALAPMPYTASRHSACAVGGRMLIFTFRSLLALDPSDGCVRELPTTGEQPGALSMCAVAPLGGGAGGESVVLFGGSTKQGAMSADAFVLDVSSLAWRRLRVPPGTSAPSPRGSSCAAPVADDTVVVFGGAGMSSEGGYAGGAGLLAQDQTWLLRVNGADAEWRLLPDEGGAPPPARVAASLSPLLRPLAPRPSSRAASSGPPAEGRRSARSFLLHGGWEPRTARTFDTSHVLELHLGGDATSE